MHQIPHSGEKKLRSKSDAVKVKAEAIGPWEQTSCNDTEFLVDQFLPHKKILIQYTQRPQVEYLGNQCENTDTNACIGTQTPTPDAMLRRNSITQQYNSKHSTLIPLLNQQKQPYLAFGKPSTTNMEKTNTNNIDNPLTKLKLLDKKTLFSPRQVRISSEFLRHETEKNKIYHSPLVNHHLATVGVRSPRNKPTKSISTVQIYPFECRDGLQRKHPYQRKLGDPVIMAPKRPLKQPYGELERVILKRGSHSLSWKGEITQRRQLILLSMISQDMRFKPAQNIRFQPNRVI